MLLSSESLISVFAIATVAIIFASVFRFAYTVSKMGDDE